MSLNGVVSHAVGALAGLALLYAGYLVGMWIQFYGRMI